MKSYIKSNFFQVTFACLVIVAAAFGWMPEAAAGTGMLVALSTTAFPVNAELTAIAIGYQNPDAALIADRVLPRVPTAKKFKYTKYSAEQGYTVPDTKVGRKSEPNMVDFGGTDLTDECQDYGLDDLVPNDEIDAYNAMPKPASGGPVSPEALSTMMLTGLVQLDREIRVSGLVFNSASYAAGNQATLSGTGQWSDRANSDPLNAITTAMDIPLVRPNKMTIGQLAWTQLRMHPKIVQAIGKSAQTAGYASLQQVADLLELQEIIVGRAVYNTAKRGQTPSYVRAWGKHCALLHIDSLAAQLGQPTFGWTAQWGTRIAGAIPEAKAGLRGGVRIRSGESVKEVIVSTDSGYFFQNCVA
ncbi:MAG: capsid protein [Pseudomonadota bacterium]